MQRQQITYLKKYWEEIVAEGEALWDCDLPELSMEEFELFFKTGNRLIYEGTYFKRRKYLTVYGLLALYRGGQKDIERLIQIILEVCKERYWALPAHVDAVTLDELTIDLFAAETAQTLTEMVYFLGDSLDETLKAQILDEVVRRVMKPYMERRTTYGWETDPCNWSAVCAGSVGMTAIYLYRMGWLTSVQKEECIQRVCASMQYYIGGLEEDGACTEGLGYYSYGMSYFTGFTEALYEESEGGLDLLRGKKCENIATFQQKCYFGHGVSVSFSDGSRTECFLPGLTAYLKSRFEEVKAPDYHLARGLHEDSCYRWLTNERNIRWLLLYGEDCNRQELAKYFQKILQTENVDDVNTDGNTIQEEASFLPNAQWMIYKDEHGNGYAAKGGHNAESHNHNDIGHFMVVCEGETFLTDLGAGEYTKEYFGEGRYDILCNRSLGHSVPLINDEEQIAGKGYSANSFAWKEENRELQISFAEAYRAGSIEKLERSITVNSCMTDEKLSLVIKDSFVSSEETQKIVENLVTQYQPIVDNSQILLNGKHGKCVITLENAVEIRVLTQKHSNHSGVSEDVYLIQWNVPITDEPKVECKIKVACR